MDWCLTQSRDEAPCRWGGRSIRFSYWLSGEQKKHGGHKPIRFFARPPDPILATSASFQAGCVTRVITGVKKRHGKGRRIGEKTAQLRVHARS